MSTEQIERRKRRPSQEEPPKLIPHRKVAKWLSIDTETLRRWVVAGEFPEPHGIIKQTWFYRASMIEHYMKHGSWPEGTRFKGMARISRDQSPVSS
jgi:predicted site-specific integrase-resolvase